MRLAILGGIAVTPERVIEDAGILIDEDGRISFVDTREQLEECEDWEDEIELGEKDVIMPGLINTHTHGPMTLFRGVADDMPLMKWLREEIWPLEERLDAEKCRWGAALAAMEALKSGTTCLADMYFFMDAVAEAYAEVGIRAVISHGMIDLGEEDKREEELKESKRVYRKCQGMEGLIEFSLGPHAPYTCSEELLKEVRRLADEWGVKIQIHVAETEDEVKEVKRKHGKRPVEYLDEIGLLGDDVIAAHCVWLDDKEIEILSKRGVIVSHNPISNMKLASGISPVPEMLERGVNVTIGTDGCASNNNLDMLEEIKVAALLHKVNKMDPSATEMLEILRMATVRAGTVFSSEKIGAIEEGYAADLVVLDGSSPRLNPNHNPISNIVYSASGSDVKHVFVAGELVVKNGKLVKADEQEILENSTECAEQLTSS
ncbi:amidohydrolase [Methanopyrus kandleri]|uniref:5'-deoxyadenosine deaminase n=2 Tax=Methanopyrus kandleri TaxID=2320 RepID=DADD_METKA|nr:amidohydrolase [Methanopyrus kandleri]Q8TYD4.1 RecName: Full=5'-deoxyadenosine deaminase; Short=5'-dA deaminase; AltName: Full=5'-methylthioadenosine deaminase; Short=MTA deaminase; AltName: Full=Adenosine deaminase; AltName: Full=S-adenosylhomocysteine deaminase; Short=SAH deaminase [Methanopyrus kandleri AV19]AAM01581.1 Predicted metal-dependent hydrolase related to cytosine deaminase [Methanopyrus kandleri AV19]HII70480.1 amidohydrolase [Methanopyrus kandleri]